MDIATIIGLVGGSILVLLAILLGGNPVMFLNASGMLIVVGGTIATCFIKFSMTDVINSINVAMKAFLLKIEQPETIMENMVRISRIAKEQGLIALENEQPDDPFTAKAIQYLADGFNEDQIKELITKDIRLTINRHSIGQKVFKGMGETAPAFGMIGTLIGLVQMLAAMSNPQDIGPAMAVALLTTLYGALLANLIFNPLADKLSLRSNQEQEVKALILDGVLGIHQGLTSMALQETLKVHLSPKSRLKVIANKAAAANESS